MKCPKCSTDNPKRAKFCLECGATLTASRKEAELETLLKAMQSFIPNSLVEKITKGKGQIEGERRFVTVMFADISGFTAMSELLDPEEVTSIMNDCYAVLAQVVYKYEGTIDKFIGDCIMVIFGAPVSHENDPERTVRCALEMQERIKKFNRSMKNTNVDLSLHIGINSGWVIVGAVGSDLRMDYTVMGDTVNLASKLESVAEKEQIYVSQRTAELVTGIVEARKLEPFRLKGKRKPVVAYEILGLSKHPRPVRDLAVRSEMVGREKEFALLKNRLNEIKESKKGRLLFINGEAGIGKSRLSEEIGHYTLKKGFLWVQGRCLSYGKAISYWVFFEMLRSIFGIWEMEDSEAIRNNVKARIKKLFAQRFEEVYPYILSLLSLKVEEEYQVKVKHLDAQALKLAQFCAVRDLFIALSRHKPVVIVFEDWQWADISSVELFEFMLNSVNKSAMLLLVVMRAERDSLGFKVLEIAKKRVRDLVDVVSLGQLEKEDSECLIKNLVSGIPETLKKLIFAKSKGNPFFVEEIIRSLIDSGVLIFKSGVWYLVSDIRKIEIPDRIELLIGSRIDRLTSELRHVLQAASVIGLSFYYRVLQYITPAVEQELNIYLNHLEGQEFILKKLSTLDSDLLTGLEYDFKHPLVQEVAYDGLLKKKRKKFHRKIGECIEEIFKDKIEDYYEILAYHYFNAEVFEKSYDYYKNAGDKAKELYQNDVAIECYTKAIEIHKRIFPDNEKEKIAELYEKRGDVKEFKTEYYDSIRDYEIAFEYYEIIENKADIKRKKGNIFHNQNEYNTAISIYEEVIKMFESKPESLVLSKTLIDYGWLLSAKGDHKRAKEMIEQAFTNMDKKKEPEIYAKGLNILGIVYLKKGELDTALKCYKRILAVSEEAGDKKSIDISFNNIGMVYWRKGELDTALEYFNKSLTTSEERGDRKGVSSPSHNIGLVYYAKGELDTAFRYYKKVLAVCEEIGDERGSGMASMRIGTIYHAQGELDTALAYYRRYLGINEKIGNKRGIGTACACIGEVYTEIEKFEDAQEYLEKAEKIFREAEERMNLAEVYRELSELRTAQENCEDALKFAEKALSLAKETGTKEVEIQALRAKGKAIIKENFGKTISYLKESISLAEKQKMNLELAKSHFELAKVLKDVGEIKESGKRLKEAKKIFEKAGAKGWLKKVEELIK
jgi:class 3 adenylate cyclase/tetratricopeptide (TPR) repeat protein